MTRDDLIKQKERASNYLKSLVTPDIGGIKMQHDAFIDLMRWESAIHIWDKAYEAGAKVERSKLFEIIKQVLDYELVLTNKFLDSNPKLSGFYFNRHHGIYDLFEHLKERIKNDNNH